jgi:hypothetical protein
MLNFAQVASIATEPIGGTQDPGFLYSLIADARTSRLLRAAGYEIHWTPGARVSPVAIPRDGIIAHPFAADPLRAAWVRSDLFAQWVRSTTPGVLWYHSTGAVPSLFTEARDQALAPLPPSSGRPRFVYRHLMATHDPLAASAACEAGVAPGAGTDARDRDYAAAVRCLDAALLRFFRATIAATHGDVVIIAVGDHSPYLGADEERATDVAAVPRAIARARFDAGAFVYLPPSIRAGFQAPGSSVNLMPAVLQALWGVALPRSPDDHYYSMAPPHPIYRFRRMEDPSP